nr:hypothetical protein [Sphingobium indicum]
MRTLIVAQQIAERKTQKPHPAQPFPDHILHSGIGQIMLGLQDQYLEHGDRVKRRTAALAAMAITKSVDQARPENTQSPRSVPELQADRHGGSASQDGRSG